MLEETGISRILKDGNMSFHRQTKSGRSDEAATASSATPIRITRISYAVTIAIGLIGISDGRTIVYISTKGVAVGIIVGIVGAGITRISYAVTIAIGLIRIGRIRAVV
jgi:hypothetical protein